MSLTGQTTTLPSSEGTKTRWETTLRVGTVGLVALIVVVGSLGLLGVRTADAVATGGGFELQVHYSAVTRPALATPFSVGVRTTDGSALPAEVTVRVSSDYLSIFDDNGIEPLPTESHNTDTWTWWTFAIPDGEESLTVALDARLEPAVQWQRSGEAAIEIDGEEVVSVEFTTGVAP